MDKKLFLRHFSGPGQLLRALSGELAKKGVDEHLGLSSIELVYVDVDKIKIKCCNVCPRKIRFKTRSKS